MTECSQANLLATDEATQRPTNEPINQAPFSTNIPNH